MMSEKTMVPKLMIAAVGRSTYQSKRDRKPDELPAVFHRKNHCEWLVTMPLDEWMKIYGEWEAGYGLRENQQENP